MLAPVTSIPRARLAKAHAHLDVSGRRRQRRGWDCVGDRGGRDWIGAAGEDRISSFRWHFKTTLAIQAAGRQ
jgi:hypothetical protein